MDDPFSSISPSASAEEYLHEALVCLGDTLESELLRDPDRISALVTCCQCATLEDASEILHNILFEEGKTVIAEYQRRRLAAVKPTSVNNSTEKPFKVYRKPGLSAPTSYVGGERNPDGRKSKDTGKSQLSCPAKRGLEISEAEAGAKLHRNKVVRLLDPAWGKRDEQLAERVELQKSLTPIVPDTQSLARRPELQERFTSADESSSHLPPYFQSSAAMARLQRGFSAFADERSRRLTLQTRKGASSSAFDICAPRNRAVSKDQPIKLSSSLLVQNRENRRNLEYQQTLSTFQYLMPGMVLLKNWLSRNDQVNLVRTCRTLGLGPGGFYQPGKMRLWMMCLGKDWDPISRSYEDTRSYDNAVPPPLPAEFIALAERAIEAAHDGIRRNRELTETDLLRVLPRMNPDICIVNFYKHTGRLGMHQDKDESRSSISKGLPVVSFSLGDSSEFVYGRRRGEDRANRVTLESGDVLIFGGPSRLVFHGVTRVHPHTSPPWLNQETGLCPGRINLTFRQL